MNLHKEIEASICAHVCAMVDLVEGVPCFVIVAAARQIAPSRSWELADQVHMRMERRGLAQCTGFWMRLTEKGIRVGRTLIAFQLRQAELN